jgi:hypothetical protein
VQGDGQALECRGVHGQGDLSFCSLVGQQLERFRAKRIAPP